MVQRAGFASQILAGRRSRNVRNSEEVRVVCASGCFNVVVVIDMFLFVVGQERFCGRTSERWHTGREKEIRERFCLTCRRRDAGSIQWSLTCGRSCTWGFNFRFQWMW